MANNSETNLFILLTDDPSSFKSLELLLNELGWEVLFVSSVASLDQYYPLGKASCLAVLNPSRTLTSVELSQIKKFFNNACLIIASGDNDANSRRASLNKLLVDLGIRFNADCVVRPNLYELYHPKEAVIEDFAANRGLSDVLKKHVDRGILGDNSIESVLFSEGLRILYPKGCTLKVDKRSTIMMTSSKWAIPTSQVICAFHKSDKNGTRLIALGSAELMSDRYIDKEQNRALVRTFLEFISNDNFPINISDSKTVEIPKYICTADINYLTNLPVSCLPESERLPSDVSSLIEQRLFSIDSSMIPNMIRAYKDLNVKHEPLTLIKPPFESTSLKLEPAVHGFLLRK